MKVLTLTMLCVEGRGSVGLEKPKRAKQNILILFQPIIQIYMKYGVVQTWSFLDGPKIFGAMCMQNQRLVNNVSIKKIMLLQRLFARIIMEGSARKKNSNKTVGLDQDVATTLPLSGRPQMAIRRRCQLLYHRLCCQFLPRLFHRYLFFLHSLPRRLPRSFQHRQLLLPLHVRVLHQTRPLFRNLRVWHRCRKIATFLVYAAVKVDAGSRRKLHTQWILTTRYDAVQTQN